MRSKTDGEHCAVQALSVDSLSTVGDIRWDRLNPSGCPFTSHAFLQQLEENQLVGPGTGWQARHLLAERGNELLAAIPLYEKNDSFGEFVFDWVWAEAYEGTGLPYFPKLVSAVPFTPVPGSRLLAGSDADRAAALPALLQYLESKLENGGYSSVHVLFLELGEAEMLARRGFLGRLDCRFLWRNAGFADFEDFLAIFKARQRKKIRRERRKVKEQGVKFEWLQGGELNPEQWSQVHSICSSTFISRGQMPYLDVNFFVTLARAMPGNVLVNAALLGDNLVGAAIFFRDQKRLYGRYWGSVMDIDCLHFECCYYQGIEYAIENGLELFDPGTQGEHKLRRGFAPVESWSVHRFASERMSRAIGGWLRQEQAAVRKYILKSRRNMPFDDTAARAATKT